MKTRVHLIISGQVQGVWYRASTKEKAEELGLFGWVKNTTHGKVEAVFEGEEPMVNEMISWCRKGPPLALVTDVKVTYQQFGGEFTRFDVLHD
jgi:acylphosphatase